MHGTIMVLMVLTTAPQRRFSNTFFDPDQGSDMAFPVLNMLSFGHFCESGRDGGGPSSPQEGTLRLDGVRPLGALSQVSPGQG